MSTVQTARMKPIYEFAQILRVDKEKREVEGYAFTKEKVGDGFRLKRTTVEKSTPDYLKFGTGPIRAMHQPVAAGQCLWVKWDKTGALIRAKITDDAEWKKVEDGTYKGFSIGFIPQVMRGESVEEGIWAETSLADRPWDDGCAFTNIFRAQGYEQFDPKGDVEVKVMTADDEGDEYPGDVSDPDTLKRAIKDLATEENPAIRRMKMKKLRKAVGKIAKVKSALNGGNLYYNTEPTLTRRENENMSTQPGAIDWQARALTAEKTLTEQQAEITRLNKKLAKKNAKLSRVEGELAVIARTSTTGTLVNQPVRYGKGTSKPGEQLNRGFAANDPGAFEEAGGGVDTEPLLARRKEIMTAADNPATDQATRLSLADEIQYIDGQLAEAGVSV